MTGLKANPPGGAQTAPFTTTVRSVGNSAGLTLNARLCKALGWGVGTLVRLDVRDGGLLISEIEQESEQEALATLRSALRSGAAVVTIDPHKDAALLRRIQDYARREGRGDEVVVLSFDNGERRDG